MNVRASILVLALVPAICSAQERTVMVEVPEDESGAVYSQFGLLGSVPYNAKVDMEKAGHLFIVTKGLHFMEVDASSIGAQGARIAPAPFTNLVSPDSIEAFRLSDFRLSPSTTTSVQFFNGIQIGPSVDYEDLARAGREYLARENFPIPDESTRLNLVPAYVKSYSWYQPKGAGGGTFRWEDYSIIHCIHWSLIDAASGRELFSKELHGGYYIGKMKLVGGPDRARLVREEQSYASRKAFVSSLQCLLRDSSFVRAIRTGAARSSGPVPSSVEETLSVTVASEPHASSIQQCLPSVVTIRHAGGLGSGFFISPDGYLLTNDHVLKAGQSEVTVVMDNGFSVLASVVRRQPEADVALLKITGARMLPLRCDSIKKPPGTEVFAIGTPEHADLSQTLTKGIISGHRELNGRSYIQTDVAINRGNSGGPLIDAQGNVIGVVTAKMMGVGTESLGFAIPIADAFRALTIE
jgi:S1-C subfamily serine protease